MITSRDFNGPEIDDFHHRDVFTAIVPGNVLTGFGESIGLYDELCIHWLPTRDYPKPDDSRLNEILPSFAEISAGIVHALEAYAVEWNVDWIRDSIRRGFISSRIRPTTASRWSRIATDNYCSSIESATFSRYF